METAGGASQRLLCLDLLQSPVLFVHPTRPPVLVHFQASTLRLPVAERGFTNTDPAAKLSRELRLCFFQHPNDLLFAKAAPFHGAFPFPVLYPEKLIFGWTKFRGASQVRF
jgi:hypothetical protein